MKRWGLHILPALLLTLTMAACDSNESADMYCDLSFSADDVVVGDGEELAVGKRAFVHYEGFLCDPTAPDNRGAKFDSSIDRGAPFEFVFGAGQVIDGWDEGMQGMKVGGKRILTLPPDKAYGAAGISGVIPGNATLIFDVDLVDVQ